jgi:hypothetical protein
VGDQATQTRKAWWEIAAALTPLILGIGVTAVGAFFTQVYNFRQLQLNQLSALEKFHTLLVSDSPSDREFAYASFAALGYEELAIKLIKVKEDSAGRTVAQEIKAGGTGPAKSEASALLSTLPVQVYLQIADDHQRGKAEAIRTALQQKGYVVPGIENVAGKADIPKNTNVRFYNDQDQAIAVAIASILRDQGLSTAYAYRVARFKARPGSIEIWFSSDAL